MYHSVLVVKAQKEGEGIVGKEIKCTVVLLLCDSKNLQVSTLHQLYNVTVVATAT